MTCDDFLAGWNARVDDPGSFAIDRADVLDAHSASCEPCRRLASGFRLLAQSMPPPAIPEGLSDRVLAAWSARDRRDRRTLVPIRWAWAAGLAAAAALTLAIFAPWTPRVGRDAEVAKTQTPKARNLGSSLARATFATLDLAREASAPAARLGQDVYVASLTSEIVWPVGIERTAAPSELFQSMSRKVNSSVLPLSGTARRAFSFLIAPTSGAAVKTSTKDDAGA